MLVIAFQLSGEGGGTGGPRDTKNQVSFSLREREKIHHNRQHGAENDRLPEVPDKKPPPPIYRFRECLWNRTEAALYFSRITYTQLNMRS